MFQFIAMRRAALAFVSRRAALVFVSRRAELVFVSRRAELAFVSRRAALAFVSRRAALAVALAVVPGIGLFTGALAEAAGFPPETATDQPLWRAMHGVLLSVTRAGNRLVAVGDRGTILLSDDQGVHWRQSVSGTSGLLTSVVFTSETDGWVVGEGSTILHTTDAGQHWSLQNSDVKADQTLFSVASLGAGHLMATGAYALALETTNASSWSVVKLPSMDEDYHLNCVMAHGPDVVIVGEAGHAFVRHAGVWSAAPVPYDGSQFGCLTRSDGSMYSFGLRGSLFLSAPSAPAWKRIDTGEQRTIFGGTVLSNGFLGLVGGNGLMMLLDPQTNAVSKLPSATGATLSGVAEASNGRWIVVGEDGLHVVDPTARNVQAGEVTQ